MFLRKRQWLLGLLFFAGSQLPVAAQNLKPSNPSLWGYTGILTVPTAQMSGDQTFHLGARYFPLNTGFGGGGYLNLFDDLEIGFAIGFPPSQRTGFGGNIKYRLFDQDKNQPVSVAAGATLVGLSTANNNSYVAGNNLFLMMSRDFYWPFNVDRAFHFLSLHGGFLGDFTHLRVAGGVEVPILEYAKIKAEYLGPTSNIPNQHTINFGANITPFPFLDITFGVMQINSSNFLTRDFIAQIGYRGNFPFDIRFKPQSAPTPRATPVPLSSPTYSGKGQLSGRVVDEVTKTPLVDQEVTLSTKNFDMVLNAKTDSQGYFSFRDVPSGEYDVLVHGGKARGSQNRTVLIQSQKETTLQISLKSNSGQLSGQVMAAGSTTGMKVELKNKGTGQIQFETSVNKGIYSFSEVAPGDYLLLVKGSDGNTLSAQSIVVKSGAVLRINIDAQTPSTSPTTPPTSLENKTKPQLFGSIKSEQSQAALQGVRLKMESKEVTILTLTGSDGTYSFRDLPNGTYRLTVSKTGFKTRIFQVTIRKKEESLSHSITLKKE